MAEIIALVTSIDSLAPFKVSDDLMLELVNVTTLVRTIRKTLPPVPAGLRLLSLIT